MRLEILRPSPAGLFFPFKSNYLKHQIEHGSLLGKINSAIDMNKTRLPWLLRTGHDLLGPGESSRCHFWFYIGRKWPRATPGPGDHSVGPGHTPSPALGAFPPPASFQDQENIS